MNTTQSNAKCPSSGGWTLVLLGLLCGLAIGVVFHLHDTNQYLARLVELQEEANKQQEEPAAAGRTTVVQKGYDYYQQKYGASALTAKKGEEIAIPDAANTVLFDGLTEGDGLAAIKYVNIFTGEKRDYRQPTVMPLEEVSGTPAGKRTGLTWIGRKRVFVFNADSEIMTYAVLEEE